MKQIKINLTSGGALQKPLVTAFKTSTGEYVVLDNELNGTMGLPIILVTKYENGSFVMVPNMEWNGVKESLRLIIAGNVFDYFDVPDNINAQDGFFKQLTLPVASFEALKNQYKLPTPVEVAPEAAAPEAVAPSTPEVTPAAPSAPEVAPTTPVEPSTPVEPVMPEASVLGTTTPVTPVAPTMPEAPKTPVTPVAPATPDITPVMPEASTQNQVTTPVTPQVDAIPSTNDVPVDFTADKEAFLKACENMFDALVAKFNK